MLTHEDKVDEQRIADVKQDLKTLNPSATILTSDKLNIEMLPEVSPSHNQADKLAHHKAHWASSSTDLPPLPDYICVKDICDALPKSILRIKGCTKIANEPHYTYFERCPDGEVYVRPYKGEPNTGAKLLTIGPGSEQSLLDTVIDQALMAEKTRSLS